MSGTDRFDLSTHTRLLAIIDEISSINMSFAANLRDLETRPELVEENCRLLQRSSDLVREAADLRDAKRGIEIETNVIVTDNGRSNGHGAPA